MRDGLKIPILSSLLLFTAACGSADLRPDTLATQGPQHIDVQRGRALLRDAARAHGIDAWAGITTIEARLQDDWQGFAGALVKPWDEEDVFTLRWVAGTFDADLTFVEGERVGERQGLQNGHTWHIEPGESLTIEPDEDTRFNLSAYIYFLELAYRLGTAEHVVALEDGVFRGQKYHRVFATWGALAPHSDADQYIVWINTDTHLVELCQFTVRDKFDFVKSWIYFDEMREIDGLSIPFIASVASDLDEDYAESYIHQLRVLEWSHDQFTPGELYVDPSLGRMGSAKPSTIDSAEERTEGHGLLKGGYM
ncbi:MAG: hypothetical protein ACE366_00175 [Bradymonadia bacterium]